MLEDLDIKVSMVVLSSQFNFLEGKGEEEHCTGKAYNGRLKLYGAFRYPCQFGFACSLL